MKNLIATVDEDFAQIDLLLRELRNRIARAAETVHVVAEKAIRTQAAQKPKRKRAKR